jgi:hypothetical protein
MSNNSNPEKCMLNVLLALCDRFDMKVGMTAFLVCLCGCGSVSSNRLDAAGIDSSDGTTSTRCDVTNPFGPPVSVDGVNTDSNEKGGWLSADQRTIYFMRAVVGGPSADLYSGSRPGIARSFTGVAPLDGVNTMSNEDRPTLTADSLTLFMEVSSTTQATDIHVSTRASISAIFSAHGTVANMNTTSVDMNPWISDDELFMYFISDRAGTLDIFKTTRTSTNSQFNTPAAISELNTAAQEYAPVLSKDELEIFFASTRDSGGMNPPDIFHATRLTPNDGFGAPTLVAELNGSTSDEYPNWLSPDRCQLMFTSNRGDGSGYDLWIATRQQ